MQVKLAILKIDHQTIKASSQNFLCCGLDTGRPASSFPAAASSWPITGVVCSLDLSAQKLQKDDTKNQMPKSAVSAVVRRWQAAGCGKASDGLPCHPRSDSNSLRIVSYNILADKYAISG